MKYSILLIILISVTSCNSSSNYKAKIKKEEIPSFSLQLLDTLTFFDTKNIPSGKPTVIFSFGPSCPYSKAQMTEIIDHIESLKQVQFYIITAWPHQQLREFYDKYELNRYTNMIVGRDINNFFNKHYDTPGVPFLAIFNRKRILINTFVGEVTSDKIMKEVLL